MAIVVNATDLDWKGRYGGGGGGTGTGTGLSKAEVQGMIDKSVDPLPKVTMEQVQQAITSSGFVDLAEVQQLIEAAGTGGSVDLPWSEIQVGFVSRAQILAYSGVIANSTKFKVPFPKAFSKTPVVVARADLGGMRFDSQMTGGTNEYFQMQTNYGADVQGVSFFAFVVKG